MATALRASRVQWLIRGHQRQHATCRHSSSFAHLQDELPRRKIAPTFEDLSPQTSYRLDMTLSDFLPATHPPPVLPPATLARELPIPHHLCYFEPSRRPSDMLADGTNPDQSPGEPFVRRMWAGGRVLYNQHNPLRLDGARGVCAEFIRSVAIKGRAGEEKVFVSVERRLAKATDDEVARLAAVATTAADGGGGGGGQAKQDLEHRVRQRLWRGSDGDFGECSVLETRNIVFLQAAAEAAQGAAGKMLKPQHETPDYTHTVVPDAKLLFRFSALTFNAHAIHLDPQYSREVEGHGERLFHGPLSYVFMVTLLNQELQRQGNEVLKSVEYRNLAPLYCHEPVTFCGKRTGEHKWDIWTQTPAGGMAVKGSAMTEPGNIDKSNLGR